MGNAEGKGVVGLQVSGVGMGNEGAKDGSKLGATVAGTWYESEQSNTST